MPGAGLAQTLGGNATLCGVFLAPVLASLGFHRANGAAGFLCEGLGVSLMA